MDTDILSHIIMERMCGYSTSIALLCGTKRGNAKRERGEIEGNELAES